jgi:hypothetical protein
MVVRGSESLRRSTSCRFDYGREVVTSVTKRSRKRDKLQKRLYLLATTVVALLQAVGLAERLGRR